MGVREKIINALRKPLEVEYIRLEDDDGISGFVVSPRFSGMPSLDRQRLIDDTLSNASPPLSHEETRRVLMIAGLTPNEYNAVGANITVCDVKEVADGVIEVLVQGGSSDAEYVRGALNNLKGVRTTEPKQLTGRTEFLLSFRANGSKASPLTKEKVIRTLKRDSHISL